MNTHHKLDVVARVCNVSALKDESGEPGISREARLCTTKLSSKI